MMLRHSPARVIQIVLCVALAISMGCAPHCEIEIKKTAQYQGMAAAADVPASKSEPSGIGIPPALYPIPYMIASADDVALVCIDKLERIDVPEGDEGHEPNRKALVKIHDLYRGSLSDECYMWLKVGGNTNPSARKGQKALYFFKPRRHAEDQPEWMNNHYGWQGFKIVDDLVEPGNAKAGKIALEAIRKSLNKYRPIGVDGPRGYALNEEAVVPFSELLSDASPAVRAWAVKQLKLKNSRRIRK